MLYLIVGLTTSELLKSLTDKRFPEIIFGRLHYNGRIEKFNFGGLNLAVMSACPSGKESNSRTSRRIISCTYMCKHKATSMEE